MKRIAIFLALAVFLPLLQLWAGGIDDPTYYAKLVTEVSSSSTGSGKVYAGTSQGTPTETSDSSDVVSTTTQNEEKTFYAIAAADAGSEFVSWTDADGKEQSKEQEYLVKVSASSKDSDNPTTVTLYANFVKKKIYYAKLNVRVATSSSGMGQVAASQTTTAGVYGATASSSYEGNTQDESKTFRAFAKASGDGYEFVGWSTTDGGASVSTESPYAVTVNASSSQAESPTTATVYANFREKPKYYAQLVAAVDAGSAGRGKVYAGTSTTAGTYSGTTSTSGQNTLTQNGSQKFYAFAQANSGSAFTGWATTPGGNVVSTAETNVLNGIFAFISISSPRRLSCSGVTSP